MNSVKAGSRKSDETAARRHPLSFRISHDLRQRLERAAAETGRSQTQEIEWRLEQSFKTQDDIYEQFGGEARYRVFRAMADTMTAIEVMSSAAPYDRKSNETDIES